MKTYLNFLLTLWPVEAVFAVEMESHSPRLTQYHGSSTHVDLWVTGLPREGKNRKKKLARESVGGVETETHAVFLTLCGIINAESLVVRRKHGSLYLHICWDIVNVLNAVWYPGKIWDMQVLWVWFPSALKIQTESQRCGAAPQRCFYRREENRGHYLYPLFFPRRVNFRVSLCPCVLLRTSSSVTRCYFKAVLSAARE